MRLIPVMAVLAAVPALFLAACSGTPRETAVLTPMIEDPVDPGDEVLHLAVSDFLGASGAPAASSYEFERFDLDGDGRRDALVLFKTPHGYWCDMHGCTMLVLKASNGDFSLVNAIQPVRAPLYVSENQSNGWRDLDLRVSGRWSPAKNVRMAFNGHEYPTNPDALPPSGNDIGHSGTRLFK